MMESQRAAVCSHGGAGLLPRGPLEAVLGDQAQARLLPPPLGGAHLDSSGPRPLPCVRGWGSAVKVEWPGGSSRPLTSDMASALNCVAPGCVVDT